MTEFGVTNQTLILNDFWKHKFLKVLKKYYRVWTDIKIPLSLIKSHTKKIWKRQSYYLKYIKSDAFNPLKPIYKYIIELQYSIYVDPGYWFKRKKKLKYDTF